MTELCQLRLEDVVLGEHPYINIVAGKDTSLKTINSKRTIPIHDDLLLCGFMEYVQHLKINNMKYLFPELKRQDGTTNSKRVSKWFNERFRVKNEIGTGKSFHSFRRTFINEMSNNGATDSEIRMIVGHKPDKQDTLNNHYKDELSIKDKSLLIKKYIRYKDYSFPWRSAPYPV
ncbi:MAG: tyrosine-type recombinase/integrase [Desulfocapsaceae bacterium]|nr:tyrosine-type recombinase/integrase [Desulfocapsaceae bacterium]